MKGHASGPGCTRCASPHPPRLSPADELPHLVPPHELEAFGLHRPVEHRHRPRGLEKDDEAAMNRDLDVRGRSGTQSSKGGYAIGCEAEREVTS